MRTSKNILTEEEMELVSLLMQNCQSTGDIQSKLKRLFAGTIQQMLEAEMDEHLGYEKHCVEGDNGGNSRNGVLGIDMEGQKDILGIWISENENASFYVSICSDLKKCGVTDIFIACHDNLKGLGEAINALFSKTKQQLCIVHQIRNSTKFVQYKDRKEICADLKKIYGAVNLDDAEYAMGEFREKWEKKYPSILRSWDANWAELTTFFNYPEEVRHLIYTTNAVEGYHWMVRKFTKSKSIFPTDDSICKVVYLSVKEILKNGRYRSGAGRWPIAKS
jgi:putative transposase